MIFLILFVCFFLSNLCIALPSPSVATMENKAENIDATKRTQQEAEMQDLKMRMLRQKFLTMLK